MQEIKLSIIVVSYNHKYLPRMCIEAIEKSHIPFSYEIIVVDNASSDDSVLFFEKAAKEKRITFIRSPVNLGYGKGNNLGVENAHGEYVFIMNPDIATEPNAIARMVDYLEKHPEIGVLGPKLVYHDGTVQDSCRRFMTFTDLIIKRTFLHKLPRFKKRFEQYLMRDFDHNHVQPVELITGAALLLRRDFYKELGGFDKRYFLFMEDFDLCQRVHQKGKHVVYFPEAEMLHFHKRLSDGSLLKLLTRKVFWHHLHSSAKYFWRWRGKRRT